MRLQLAALASDMCLLVGETIAGPAPPAGHLLRSMYHPACQQDPGDVLFLGVKAARSEEQGERVHGSA